jgi:hypothetical protein
MKFSDFLLEKENKFLMPKLTESDLLPKSNKDIGREKILTEIGNTDTNIKFKKSIKNIVDDYNDWINDYPNLTNALFNLTVSRTTGPGEILLYFIFDDIYLGGTQSSVDLITKNGKPIAEVKGVQNISKNGYINDFKFGTEANKANIHFFTNLMNFVKNYKKITGNFPPGYKEDQPGEISSSTLEKWKKIDLNDKSLYKNNDIKIELEMTRKGDIFTSIDDKKITNINNKDALPKLKKLSMTYEPKFNKNKITNIQTIIDIWKNDILNSKIVDHPFLFLNTNNKKAIKLLTLNEKNIDIYRISREHVRVALKI